MKRHDYYKFFGETYSCSFYTPPIGKPIKIGLFQFMVLFVCKYLVVRVPLGTDKKQVILAAVEKQGANKNSYFAKLSLKQLENEE